MARMPGRGTAYEDRRKATWERDYAKAELGDDVELADALREIGMDNGWIAAPTEVDAMNAHIRVQAGRGSQADRDVLAARDRAYGSGKGA